MRLTERLNVLIQATTLSQKSGVLTLDDAVKAKSAIDIISTGTLDQNFNSAINALIEIAAISQKKGAYSLKDACMIYMAIDGIEREIQNEICRLTGQIPQEIPQATQEVETNVLEYSDDDNQKQNSESVIIIPPKKLKKKY